MKPSEQFHENLLTQYKELIHEKLLESDHKLEFDHDLFEKLLFQVMKAAQVDGLSPEEVLELIEIAKREVPSHRRAV
jgi:hypothetical protein